jgi:hypothetical protein
MASAHAGGTDDPDPIAKLAAKIFEQPQRTGELTAQAVAHSHGQRRGRHLAVHDNIEMSIKRSDLVDLDECEPHLLRKRREMPCMQAPEMVLQQVQVFDEQVAPALAFAKQFLHLTESDGIDLTPLRMIRPAPPARPRMDAPVVSYGCAHAIAAAIPSPPFRGEREGPARNAGG